MSEDAEKFNRPLASLDLWFEFGSNYSYLSVMRIEQAAANAGVKLRWQPFLLGPLFQSFGWSNSPFVLQKEKGAYVWNDMARQSAKYSIPWRRPTVFPRAAVLPLRVALLGADQPWMADFCRQVMLMNFAQDHDIHSVDAVTRVLERLHLPAQRLIAEAQTETNKLRLRQQTDAAKARGIFGAPTFFAGDEMFWGNDRLDDALAHCVRMVW